MKFALQKFQIGAFYNFVNCEKKFRTLTLRSAPKQTWQKYTVHTHTFSSLPAMMPIAFPISVLVVLPNATSYQIKPVYYLYISLNLPLSHINCMGYNCLWGRRAKKELTLSLSYSLCLAQLKYYWENYSSRFNFGLGLFCVLLHCFMHKSPPTIWERELEGNGDVVCRERGVTNVKLKQSKLRNGPLLKHTHTRAHTSLHLTTPILLPP